jgi:hypothetical protein
MAPHAFPDRLDAHLQGRGFMGYGIGDEGAGLRQGGGGDMA